MKVEYKVKKEKQTINQILKNELNISSRLLYKLINKKLVYLNNNQVDTRNEAFINDIITIDLSYEEDNTNILPKQMALDIVYEDEALIVLNKPSGIAVHPSILHYEDSLSNGLKYYYDSKNIKKKIRPVNRLDYYTSGLIIFAKNEYIQETLIKQMEQKTFKKEYLAIVTGILPEKKGTINKPIGRKEGSIIERTILEDGKPSITHYEVLEEKNNLSLVRCILETGRTHQIRVHFASIGHPLLGDELYGNPSPLIKGQALICNKLEFVHPTLTKKITFNLNRAYFSELQFF